MQKKSSALFSVGLMALLLCEGLVFAVGISNPTFEDADGDGKPEGWELKVFFLEKQRKAKPGERGVLLSLKIHQEKENRVIGEATTVFNGPAGYYQITVCYMDENDGIARAKIQLNGKTIHIWDFDNIFYSYERKEVVDQVYLKPGDRLTLWAGNDATEFCRIKSFDVAPCLKPPTAAELEEKTPPPVADKDFGALVPLKAHRSLDVFELQPDSNVKTSGGDVIFYGTAGEIVPIELASRRLKVVSKCSLAFLGKEATGLEPGEVISPSLDFPVDEVSGMAVAQLTLPSTGFYRFGFYGVELSMDKPHVFLCAPKSKTGLRAAGRFYFFVPKGTRSFSVKANSVGGRMTEVIFLAPDGTLVQRAELESKDELAVRVRPGQDDGIWIFSAEGISPTLSLRGIPPLLATHPRNLFVPKESVAPTK